jgi:hypothetical protein
VTVPQQVRQQYSIHALFLKVLAPLYGYLLSRSGFNKDRVSQNNTADAAHPADAESSSLLSQLSCMDHLRI